MEITFLPQNTSEIHLHVEQLLQNTYWTLAEDLRLPKRQGNPHVPWYGKREKKKQRQKNRAGTWTSGRELWRRKSFHTLGSPFTSRDGGGRGEALEPHRRAQQKGCREQRQEIPSQRIGADQYSPDWEACLLTYQSRWELGAEARALEVRSQGEGWGWLHEDSLRGLVCHS